MSTTHARRRFARFTALFRDDPARPPRPAVYMGSPGFGGDVYLPPAPDLTPEVRATLDRLRAQAEAMAQPPAETVTLTALPAETAPWAPWDRPGGAVPHSEPETPLECEYQSWYGWGTTLPDNRQPMPRAYVPEPYVPGDDFRDLPLFRAAIRWHAQGLHAGCACEPADEDEAAGWLASQYADLWSDEPVLAWWAAAPVQAEDAPAEMRAAA